MTCRPSGRGRITPFRAHPYLVGQRLHLEDALVADGEVPGETLSLSSSDTWPRITKASIRVLFQFLLLPSLKRECDGRKWDCWLKKCISCSHLIHLSKARVGEGGEGALLSSFSAPEKKNPVKCSSVDSKFRRSFTFRQRRSSSSSSRFQSRKHELESSFWILNWEPID